MAKKWPQKRLLKDIVIPAGTVFSQSAWKTVRHGGDHFTHTIGLSSDSSGDLTYCIDDPALDCWFEDV